MRKPARVLAYCRVSSRDQGDRGTSLDGQRERIVAWCRDHDFPAPQVFVEVESGGEERREKRAELERLLAEARAGDLVVTILVDRWTRDVVAGVQDVRALLAKGVGWYAIEEEIDATTDAGKDALGQRAAGAEAERRRIRRRTVGARNRSRDQGLWVEGPAPYGYRRGDRAKREQLHLEVVPEEARVLRGAFERCANGRSLDEIAEWLNVEKGSDHDRVVVWRLLRNRVYLGEVRSSAGAWIRATWEPIVDRDLFERAKAARLERRKGGRKPSEGARTASWLLRGLAACPRCGARMGAAYSRNCGYYACNARLRPGTCDADYARVDRVDARANEQALERLLELRRELAKPSAEAPKATDFGPRKSQLVAELGRAETMAVRGALSEEGLRRQRTRIDEELGRIAVAEAAAARALSAHDVEARRQALTEVRRMQRAWELAPVELRRACLTVLAKAIRIEAEDVAIEWKTADELACQATVDAQLFAWPDDAPPAPEVEPPPRRPKGPRR